MGLILLNNCCIRILFWIGCMLIRSGICLFSKGEIYSKIDVSFYCLSVKGIWRFYS